MRWKVCLDLRSSCCGAWKRDVMEQVDFVIELFKFLFLDNFKNFFSMWIPFSVLFFEGPGESTFFFYSNLLTVFKYTVCQTSKHSNLTLITNISTYSQFKLTWNKTTLLSVLVNIIWHLVTCSSAFYETLQTNFQTNFVLFYSPYLDLQITKLIREREEGLTGNCTILLFCCLFSERPEIITVQFQQQP